MNKCQVVRIETTLFGTLIGLVVESITKEHCQQISRELRKFIPKELLPAKIVSLSSFPALPNGKQDRLEIARLARDLVNSHYN